MEVKLMSRIFAATALREGRWWVISIPEIDTVTQTRNLREVPEVAKEAIALYLDIDEDSFEVNVRTEIPDEFKAKWEQSKALDERARAQAREAGIAAREAVLALRGQGLTQRDIALVLGVSAQRVSQLEREGSKAAA